MKSLVKELNQTYIFILHKIFSIEPNIFLQSLENNNTFISAYENYIISLKLIGNYELSIKYILLAIDLSPVNQKFKNSLIDIFNYYKPQINENEIIYAFISIDS